MRGEAEGVAGRLQMRRGRLGGKQEVARASPALATELLRGEGRKTTEWRRWARPASSDGPLGGLERQVSCVLFYFPSVFLFYLISFATVFK